MPPLRPNPPRGFTLIEMLVATTIFVILAGVLLSVTSGASHIWQQAEGQKARRQAARIILDTISRDLESAVFPRDTNTTSIAFLQNVITNPGVYDSAFWRAYTPADARTGVISEVGYFVLWDGSNSALCRYYVPGNQAGSVLQNTNTTTISTRLNNFRADPNNNQGILAENVLRLWLTLYGTNSTGMVALTNYDSTKSTNRPLYAQVSLAMIDQRTFQRFPTNQMSSLYTLSPTNLMSSLPVNIQAGVDIFTMLVPIHAASVSQ